MTTDIVQLKMKKSKYLNIRTEIDGIKFASKAEAKRYQELKLMLNANNIKSFIMQTPWLLPGGVKYISDFLVFHNDGTIVVEDVKGVKTDVYKLKKRLFEASYPFKITEI